MVNLDEYFAPHTNISTRFDPDKPLFAVATIEDMSDECLTSDPTSDETMQTASVDLPEMTNEKSTSQSKAQARYRGSEVHLVGSYGTNSTSKTSVSLR